MSRKDQTAPNYVPSLPGTPYPEVQPPRHTVVQGDNKASEPMVLVIAYLVLFLVGGLFAWSVQSLTDWSLAAVALVVLPLIAGLGFVLFLAANGDWLGWREIVANYRNQNLAIKKHAELLEASEDHRHAEAMRSLDIQETQVQMDGQLRVLMMQVEDIKRHLLTVAETPAPVSPAKFVEADPLHAAAKSTAINYAVSLYEKPGAGGTPHPSRVLLTGSQIGRIKGETPFSKRGRWGENVRPEVGQRAAELLFHPDNGAPPVIVEVPGGYALNLDAYPTRQVVWQKFA